MEDFFGILTGLAIMALFAFATHWITQKYFGIRLVRRFGIREAYQDQMKDQEMLKYYRATQPALVDKAIDSCRKKLFALTATNVLNEVLKLELQTRERLKKNSISSDNDSPKIDEVETQINELQSEIDKLIGKSSADSESNDLKKDAHKQTSPKSFKINDDFYRMLLHAESMQMLKNGERIDYGKFKRKVDNQAKVGTFLMELDKMAYSDQEKLFWAEKMFAQGEMEEDFYNVLKKTIANRSEYGS